MKSENQLTVGPKRHKIGNLNKNKNDSSFEKLSRSTNSSYVSYGVELCLSNTSQIELLKGIQEQGFSIRMAVRGLSMFPFIRNQDIITISPFKKNNPHIGEIVACIWPDSDILLVHRIIAKVKTGWILRGDNCIDADGTVMFSQIIGRVVSVERKDCKVRIGLYPLTGNFFIALLSKNNLLISLVKNVSLFMHKLGKKSRT